ncbi:MAG: DUF342 domain-containing protein [Clostridiales bacterium]|nr:DUF342 domain-containing protein [Clostridiales bacterium]
MQHNVVFSSEYIKVTKKNDEYFLESFRKGMTLEQFNRLMIDHPEIRVTSIMTIRNALVNAPRPPEKFGEMKERICIELSEDELKAYVTLSVTADELEGSKKDDLFTEILRKLKEKGIAFGINTSLLLNNLTNNTKMTVAEGIPAIDGTDSVIEMYKISDIKPEVKEDGNVDHYELNLINRVNAGDWLGERSEPSNGRQGKTVRGAVIHPRKGKLLPLVYDKKTVREEFKNDKTYLYAINAGAVHYEGDRIGVSNHLEISGNIDFKTGNVDFDGFLTVKGTIEDNFSVIASRDIEILGDFGLGSVKDIVSREGNIYIKGGIAGKNKAVIRSKKNIYTKFVSDTTIICEGSVHIGFYCLNSSIKAKEVILDSAKGQIIGGDIQAEYKVVSSFIGAASEKRTLINVAGFSRESLKRYYEKLCVEVEAQKAEMAKAKQEVGVYTGISDLTREQMATYEKIKDSYFEIKDKVKQLEEERKNQLNYLKTLGEGEITVLKKVFPNTQIEIKGHMKEINEGKFSTRFYVQDGVIKEL